MMTNPAAAPQGPTGELGNLLKILQLASDPRAVENTLAELAKARADVEAEQGRLKQFEIDLAVEREAAQAALAQLAEAQELFDRRAEDIAGEQERLAEARQVLEDDVARAKVEREAGIQELVDREAALLARTGKLVDRERLIAIRETAVQAERADVDRDTIDLERREAALAERQAKLRELLGA